MTHRPDAPAATAVPLDSPTAQRPSRRAVLGHGLRLATAAAAAGVAMSPTAAAATTRWVRGPYADVFSSRSSASAPFSRLGEAVPVVGTAVDATWWRVSSGAMSGRYVRQAALTSTNPATQRFAAPSSNPLAVPAAGTSVVRHVISGDFWVNTHATPSFASASRGGIAPRARVTGKVVSSDWIRLSDGRYLTTAVLATTPTVRSFNGALPASCLRALPSYLNTGLAGTRTLSRVAAAQFIAMDAAFKARFGYHITVNEGYRNLGWQRYWYGQYGAPRAAYPGTSNHGMGLAVDLRSGSGSPFTFGSTADRWLTTNGPRFGWDRPWWLDAGHGNPEYWHYNFVG